MPMHLVKQKEIQKEILKDLQKQMAIVMDYLLMD
jgi:hypothetical protein